MHPSIKIVSLVIISIFLTQGGWSTLLLTGALLLPFYFTQPDLWRPAIKMLFRLKWFFISILFIYYFYSPSIYQIEQTPISQLVERLKPGLFRIAVLVFILFTVNLFIKTTSKEEILSALLWLFSPLTFFKINIERMSLRAVLTLEYITALSDRLKQYKKDSALTDINPDCNNRLFAFVLRKKLAFVHLIQHSGIILREILEEAETTSGRSYTLDYIAPPKFSQFLFPLVLSLLFYLSL